MIQLGKNQTCAFLCGYNHWYYSVHCFPPILGYNHEQ